MARTSRLRDTARRWSHRESPARKENGRIAEVGNGRTARAGAAAVQHRGDGDAAPRRAGARQAEPPPGRKPERAGVACERCPELRAYCAEVGRVKKRAFRDQEYWARPVPGWGDPDARIVLVGLAPGAHGSNRTGRPFTGDGSGEWL